MESNVLLQSEVSMLGIRSGMAHRDGRLLSDKVKVAYLTLTYSRAHRPRGLSGGLDQTDDGVTLRLH